MIRKKTPRSNSKVNGNARESKLKRLLYHPDAFVDPGSKYCDVIIKYRIIGTIYNQKIMVKKLMNKLKINKYRYNPDGVGLMFRD
jgi:hypothetical protein